MVLAVDASVGLKWVLQEAGSDAAERLAGAADGLVMPDFWLNEATSVLWLRVRRNLLSADDARDGLMLLSRIVRPTPTYDMGLHELALDIGMAVGHSVYDTLYVAFALAMGAARLVVANSPFVAAMSRHPDPVLASLLLPLNEWVR